MPDNLPDDPELLKQMLLEAFELLGRQQEIDQAHQSQIVDLKEQIKLLRDRLFGRKSGQAADPQTPQLALFNEPESVELTAPEDDEEVVALCPRRGKRKPLSADLPRIEVTHELPEHELTCVCGCRKHTIGEEISEQLEIVPMQILVIRYIRKVYGCRGCETAPVTADKPAQLDRKEHCQPQRVGDAADHQVRRWPAAAPFRNSPRSSRCRYHASNPGARGDPAKRTLPAVAEPDA